jgi:hypothetical protein
MKRKSVNGTKRNGRDPNQKEFGIIWHLEEYPFRLRAGDVFKMEGRFCRVIHVTECSAVLVMHRPVREFKTRFDKPVRFQPPPKITRVSPNSEVEVLNRR